MQNIFVAKKSVTTSAGAYSAGDQVGGISEIANVFGRAGCGAIIHSVTLQDLADQKANIQLLFFDKLPTLIGSDNAAFSISDAELTAKCIGALSIATADYVDIGSQAVATKTGLHLALRPQVNAQQGVSNGQSLFVVMLTSGTPTYGSGAKLNLVIGSEQYT